MERLRLLRGMSLRHPNRLRFSTLDTRRQSSSSPSSPSPSSGRMASRRLYRILQRQCAEFSKMLPSHATGETMFLVQPLLNPIQSGSHRILSIKTLPSDSDEDIRNLLVFFRDWNEDNGEDDAYEWYKSIQKDGLENPSDNLLDVHFSEEPTMWTSVSSIQRSIRYAFRHTKQDANNNKNNNLQHDDGENDKRFRRSMNKFAINGVKILMEQAAMWRLTSVSYENDIRVVATSKHTGNSHTGPRRSDDLKYRFNYRIRIENLSDQETVQLLGRNWHIEEYADSSGDDLQSPPITVDAPLSGAVGQLPVLRPGDAFEYMSSCELATPRGSMQGSFHLAKVPMDTPSATLNTTVAAFSSPDKFQVKVNPFPLQASRALTSSKATN